MLGKSRTIRYAAAGTVLAAALQVLAGALLWAHRSAFVLAQAHIHPDWPSARVADRADGIIVGGMATHLVWFAMYLAFSRGVWLGSRSARVRLTVLLAVTTIVGAVATRLIGGEVPSISQGMLTVQVISTVLRLAVLYLLWVPPSSRAHFAPTLAVA